MKYITFQNLDGGRTVIAKDGNKFWHWLTIVLLVGVISVGGTYFQRKVHKMDREAHRLRLLEAAEQAEPKTKATRQSTSLASIRAAVENARIRKGGDVRSDAKQLLAVREARAKALREAKEGS